MPEIDRSTYINLTTSHSEEDETESSPFKHPRRTPLDNSTKGHSLSVITSFKSTPEAIRSPLAETATYKYRRVWRRALLKLKIRRAMDRLNDDILVYGTSNDLLDLSKHFNMNIDTILENKCIKNENFIRVVTIEENPLPWYIINPDSTFSKLWGGVVACILLYTATLMPFRVAWEDSKLTDNWSIIEFVIDGLFIIDIIVNFFTTYQTKDGLYSKSLKSISIRYLRSWFLFDLSACIPFSLIDVFADENESGDNIRYNSLIRLARLPRLYRLIRIVRILKAIRFYKQSEIFEKIQDFLQINSRIYKLLRFLMTVCICVHIMGCFWFFSAKIQDFGPDTWVVRYGYADSSSQSQYMAAIYWAFTTVTTVGYGDISAGNPFEQILCIFWMIAGVGFYSFTIGSLSSFLSEIDTRDSILSSKLAVVHEFSKESGISSECKQKIRDSIKYSISKQGTVWSDKHSLFRDLPKSLRYEVAVSMYNGISKSLHFFRNRNSSFIIAVMPLMKPLRVEDKEYLYKQGDFPDEVYFITKGRVNLVLEYSEIAYKSFLKGAYIGEIEIVMRKTSRFDNVQVCGNTEFLIMSKKDFLLILDEFPDEAQQINNIAKERFRRNIKVKHEIKSLLDMTINVGTATNSEQNSHSIRGRLTTLDTVREDEKEAVQLDKLEEDLKATKDTVNDLALKIDVIEKNVSLILDKLTNMQSNGPRPPSTALGRIIRRSQSPNKPYRLPPLNLPKE